MSKPRLFIGSSAERLDIAEALHQALEHFAEVTPWHLGAFGPSEYPLESLGTQLDTADFAVFVFAPDDVTRMREEEFASVRDNVIFELGLFIGRLGRRRTFVVKPRGMDMRLPTDLDGFGPVDYEADRGDANLAASVGPAASKIRSAMKLLGPLHAEPAGEPAQQEPLSATKEEKGETPRAFTDPGHDWDFDDYTFAYFVASLRSDAGRKSVLTTAFNESPHREKAENSVYWDAWAIYCAIHYEKASHLTSQLRAIADQHPSDARIAQLFAQTLQTFGDKSAASRTAMAALPNAKKPQIAKRLISVLKETSPSFEEAALLEISRHVRTLELNRPGFAGGHFV